MFFHDNSKEEPMKFCSDYKYSRRTEKMYIDYYKEKENGKD
jgi:DNA primase